MPASQRSHMHAQRSRLAAAICCFDRHPCAPHAPIEPPVRLQPPSPPSPPAPIPLIAPAATAATGYSGRAAPLEAGAGRAWRVAAQGGTGLCRMWPALGRRTAAGLFAVGQGKPAGEPAGGAGPVKKGPRCPGGFEARCAGRAGCRGRAAGRHRWPRRTLPPLLAEQLGNRAPAPARPPTRGALTGLAAAAGCRRRRRRAAWEVHGGGAGNYAHWELPYAYCDMNFLWKFSNLGEARAGKKGGDGGKGEASTAGG